MRKSIPIIATSLAVILASGTAMANEQKPAKKAAAEAPSAQPADDTWITTKVKASLLADTAVAGSKIDVDTVNGVVYLTGTANSQAQVDAAKKIAAGIQGVSNVDASKLKVTPAGGY
jgi:hyperosmotically inducible protein